MGMKKSTSRFMATRIIFFISILLLASSLKATAAGESTGRSGELVAPHLHSTARRLLIRTPIVVPRAPTAGNNFSPVFPPPQPI